MACHLHESLSCWVARERRPANWLNAMIAKSSSSELGYECRHDCESDEELLVHYRDTGDAAYFETLVRRVERPLQRFLWRYLRNAALADEVFQATIFRVHEKCGSFDEHRKVRPWVYRIATNQAIDLLRRESRHQAASLDEMHSADDTDLGRLLDLLASSTATPPEQAVQRERADWIHLAVDALPDHRRVAMLLIFFEGFKYGEVAEILQIPEGTVKSRVHKALLALRRAWRRDHRGE